MGTISRLEPHVDPEVWAHACAADGIKDLPEGDFDSGGYLLATVMADGGVALAATMHPRRYVSLMIKRGARPRLVLLSHKTLRYERLKRNVLKAAYASGARRLELDTVTELVRAFMAKHPRSP